MIHQHLQPLEQHVRFKHEFSFFVLVIFCFAFYPTLVLLYVFSWLLFFLLLLLLKSRTIRLKALFVLFYYPLLRKYTQFFFTCTYWAKNSWRYSPKNTVHISTFSFSQSASCSFCLPSRPVCGHTNVQRWPIDAYFKHRKSLNIYENDQNICHTNHGCHDDCQYLSADETVPSLANNKSLVKSTVKFQ